MIFKKELDDIYIIKTIIDQWKDKTTWGRKEKKKGVKIETIKKKRKILFYHIIVSNLAYIFGSLIFVDRAYCYM